MKPAVRLAALMRLNVKYVWTHDSFRVGEDGPTHQPVEHEAQIRLMEQLYNHHDERSMVVLRPADAQETTAAWKVALESERPAALILSRQNIKKLPVDNYDGVARGGYVVMENADIHDITLVASGSEVSTLVDGARLLAADGVRVRVVSVPSEGLFRDQSSEYQRSVLSISGLKFGMTSGLPSTLAGLIGDSGIIYGLHHFGYSAPAGVLDEQFGFNGQNVYERVKDLLAASMGC
jgi:transketolase